MQIEQKPNKKDELMVANSVLKLAADLLKVNIYLLLIEFSFVRGIKKLFYCGIFTLICSIS